MKMSKSFKLDWWTLSTVAMAMAALLSVGMVFPGTHSIARADDPGKAPPPTLVQGISKPSEIHNLSFTDIGILKEMVVKPGDVVKAGQVVASQDSDLEQLQYLTLKVEAESTAEIDAAIADRDEKKLKAKNLEQAYSTNAANGTELEEAKLDYQIAEIKIRDAKEKHDQRLADLEHQARKIEKMKLLSPIDGIVKTVNLQSGEIVEPNKTEGALTIVKIKPLWLDVNLPPIQAAQLQVGQTLEAAYVDQPDQWLTGKIIFLDPVVDATVDKRTVRVELPNDEEKPAGLLMNVRLPSAGEGR